MGSLPSGQRWQSSITSTMAFRLRRLSARCIASAWPSGGFPLRRSRVASGSHGWLSFPGRIQHPHARDALSIGAHDVAPSLPDGSALQQAPRKSR